MSADLRKVELSRMKEMALALTQHRPFAMKIKPVVENTHSAMQYN